jgi:hypothetical protein
MMVVSFTKKIIVSFTKKFIECFTKKIIESFNKKFIECFAEMWRKKRKVSALFFPFIFVGRAVAK